MKQKEKKTNNWLEQFKIFLTINSQIYGAIKWHWLYALHSCFLDFNFWVNFLLRSYCNTISLYKRYLRYQILLHLSFLAMGFSLALWCLIKKLLTFRMILNKRLCILRRNNWPSFKNFISMCVWDVCNKWRFFFFACALFYAKMQCARLK